MRADDAGDQRVAIGEMAPTASARSSYVVEFIKSCTEEDEEDACGEDDPALIGIEDEDDERVQAVLQEQLHRVCGTQAWTPSMRRLRHQLHRKNFTERIKIEGRIRASCWQLTLFLCMFGSYLATILTYDPINRVSHVHASLRSLYKVDELPEVATLVDIMGYLQTFFETSYEMASALVDANTLDSVDLSRCFSSSVNDICRLKYWSVPLQRAEENWINMEALINDSISPLNFFSPSLACNVSSRRPENCINWTDAVDPRLTRRTLGLTPEDPIIMATRMNFSRRSVVVLTPVIWQKRNKPVPCSGFGNQYNDEVLGAGECSEDKPCNPQRTTKFKNTRPAPRNNRTQNIYLTYDTAAFTCVDDNTAETEWLDRSWGPRATRQDMTVGAAPKKTQFGGSTVFYKFVPDTAYMQAPITGEDEYLLKPDPCSTFDPDQVCVGDDHCTDPFLDPEHPLWQPENASACNLRRLWNDRYLGAPYNKRQNTWLTYETSQLSTAALVVTPQRSGIADIVTIVRVDFSIDVDGYVTAKSSFSSTAETAGRWYWYFGITVAFSVLSFLEALEWRCQGDVMRRCCPYRAWSRAKEERRHHEDLFEENLEKRGTTSAMDIFVSILTLIHVCAIFILDSLPPYETEELIAAFEANESEQYFRTITRLMDYHLNLDLLKLVGFLLVIVLFLRMCLYMALHPRLAVLADTMVASSDDIFHFMIYFLSSFVVLSILGYWSFGASLKEHQSMTSNQWIQFQFFTGTLVFEQTPSFSRPTEIAYAAYMLIYIIVVFIMLLNFLLAIVVNGYTVVQEHMQQNQAEKNLCVDAVDIVYWSLYEKLMGWPDTYSVWRYIKEGGCGLVNHVHTLPAVTAEELYERVLDRKGEKAFPSLGSAQKFVNIYARKVWEDGRWVLLECRRENHLPPGAAYVPTEMDAGIKNAVRSRRAMMRADSRQKLKSESQLQMQTMLLANEVRELRDEGLHRVQPSVELAKNAMMTVSTRLVRILARESAAADGRQDAVLQETPVASPSSSPSRRRIQSHESVPADGFEDAALQAAVDAGAGSDAAPTVFGL